MATHAIADEQIGQFGAGIHGDLIPPDAVRSAWNRMIDGCPTSIVRRTDVADAIDAATFAGEQDLPLAVRGDGHDAGDTTASHEDDAIDLPGVDCIRVDPGRPVDLKRQERTSSR